MAIVVETVATTSLGGGTTITKPVGLVVGDLLLAVVADDQYNSNILVTPAGWTELFRETSGSNNYAEVLVCYIVATSTETAASNFTFTNATGGILYRISGAVPSLISTGTGAVSSSQSLVIAIGLSGDNDGDSATFSGYSVTGGASVSFTERFDSTTGSLNTSLGVADGVYNSSSNITAFSVTAAGAPHDDNATFLIKIPASQNATATNALFQTSPDTFATLTGSTQAPNNDFKEISPEFSTQSASATNPTQWVNDSLPTTNWTNES
jgi:hypothetical protein